MIIKCFKVSRESLGGTLRYVTREDGRARDTPELVRRVGGDMAGERAEELLEEYRLRERLNPRAQHVAHHIVIAPGRADGWRDDQELGAWAERVHDRLGFGGCPYVAYRHNAHCHLLTSRIDEDGHAVRTGWDYTRGRTEARRLEREYGLERTVERMRAGPAREREVRRERQVAREEREREREPGRERSRDARHGERGRDHGRDDDRDDGRGWQREHERERDAEEARREAARAAERAERAAREADERERHRQIERDLDHLWGR